MRQTLDEEMIKREDSSQCQGLKPQQVKLLPRSSPPTLVTAMLFANVPLDCQISPAGHARPGLRAAGHGPRCPARSNPLHASATIGPPTAARNAMPSSDGAVENSPTPRIWALVSRRRQLLPQPRLLLPRSHPGVGASRFQSALFL